MTRPTRVLLLLCLPLALAAPPGLSCVNDLVSSVKCTWPDVGGARDCWVSGRTRVWKNGARNSSCRLSRSTPARCSMTFHPHEFNPFEVLPEIHVQCDGRRQETISKFQLQEHVQMNPPGLPKVSKLQNGTLIRWSPDHPRSIFIKEVQYQAMLHQSNQSRERVLLTSKAELTLEPHTLKGECQVKVRVKTQRFRNISWSDWSPTTSWTCSDPDPDRAAPEQPPQIIVIIVVVTTSLLCLAFLGILLPLIWKRAVTRKPVPNPASFFQTIHGGNLKKWLNPHSSPTSFFVVQLPENISTVEVCESWAVARPTSPASSTGLMGRSRGTTGSDTSGVVDSSSSSFSNMGYFLSSSGSRTTVVKLPWRVSLPVLLTTDHGSERSKELDSGFSLGKWSEEDERGSLLAGPILAHALLPAPLHSSSSVETQTDRVQLPPETPAAAWPSTHRASSMPVESGTTGYFTLKDVQATFRNNSL